MRIRLTYANVVSTVALFLVLTGGVVYAASKVRSKDIKKAAVTTGKIAPRAVTTKRLRAEAVTPGKMSFPVHYVGSPSGGEVAVPGNGTVPYPIDDNTWEQNPGEINVIFGGADATIAYDGSGSGNCQVYFDIRLNGQQVGGGQIQTDSTSPTELSASLGAQPLVDPEAPITNEMTMNVGSNGDCTPESTVDSSHFRILDFG